MKNPIDILNRFAAWLDPSRQNDPVPWTVGGEAKTPMNLHEIPMGLPLFPVDRLSSVTREKQRKLLNDSMKRASRVYKDTTYPTVWLDDYKGKCVLHSLIILQNCWGRGFPARLVSCDVRTTKWSMRTRTEHHMVVECLGWILDSLRQDVISNVDYMGEYVSICNHGDKEWAWFKLGI